MAEYLGLLPDAPHSKRDDAPGFQRSSSELVSLLYSASLPEIGLTSR